MTADTIAKRRESDTVDRDLANAFAAIVGAANVLSSFDDRLGYARDRLPYAVFRERAGEVAGRVPRLVCARRTRNEIVRLVQLAQAARSR